MEATPAHPAHATACMCGGCAWANSCASGPSGEVSGRERHERVGMYYFVLVIGATGHPPPRHRQGQCYDRPFALVQDRVLPGRPEATSHPSCRRPAGSVVRSMFRGKMKNVSDCVSVDIAIGRSAIQFIHKANVYKYNNLWRSSMHAGGKARAAGRGGRAWRRR